MMVEIQEVTKTDLKRDLKVLVKNTRNELERIIEQKGGYWELEDSLENVENIIEIIELLEK